MIRDLGIKGEPGKPGVKEDESGMRRDRVQDMSEELGVRSEELIKQLRHCATTSLSGCNDCPYSNDFGCMSTMLLNAADELERRAKERRYLLKIADCGDCTCGSCRHGVMAGKPCPVSDDIDDCEDCGKCICGECRDGDKWEWDGKE